MYCVTEMNMPNIIFLNVYTIDVSMSYYFIMLHFWRFLSIENLVGYFELFWRHIYINAPNTAWRYIDRSLQALQTLYWPLNFSGSKECRFEIMTGTWRYVRRDSRRPENLLVLRCPENYGSIFQAFLRVKCNITVISLLFGKYTKWIKFNSIQLRSKIEVPRDVRNSKGP